MNFNVPERQTGLRNIIVSPGAKAFGVFPREHLIAAVEQLHVGDVDAHCGHRRGGTHQARLATVERQKEPDADLPPIATKLPRSIPRRRKGDGLEPRREEFCGAPEDSKVASRVDGENAALGVVGLKTKVLQLRCVQNRPIAARRAPARLVEPLKALYAHFRRRLYRGTKGKNADNNRKNDAACAAHSVRMTGFVRRAQGADLRAFTEAAAARGQKPRSPLPADDERGTSAPKEEAILKIAVIQFPGSNADWDALHVARDVLGADARYVFHKSTELGDADAVIIPGGFSYGDYLRPGAIARFSPITHALVAFAKAGGPILGICNGFQILTELQLLPGALTRNAHLRFECRDIHLRREGDGAFTNGITPNKPLRMPIAHADGRYQCAPETLKQLEDKGRVAFRYCDATGSVPTDDDARDASGLRINPNGSLGSIAGIYDDTGRILGMMPHPERASEGVLGGRKQQADGLSIFQSLKAHLEGAGQ